MAELKLIIDTKKVADSVLATKRNYKARARILTRKVGVAARDNVRANVMPRSAGGVFPGYAMTGALRNKVTASQPKRLGEKGWEVIVRVQLTGKTKLYALIHENGGIIRAKNAPFLVFQIMGQWFRKKVVRITRKQYFRKGIEKTIKQFGSNKLGDEF